MTTGRARRGTADRCRCGRCGADYGAIAFGDLVPVRTLGESDLTDYVIRWPDGIVVDVRKCARCETPIARLLHRA